MRHLIDLIEHATTLARDDVETFANDVKARLGLKQFHVFLSHDDIKLDGIIASKKGEGQGTQALQAICAFADEHGRRIILTPGLRDDHHGTTSRARLVRFYKRFGFVENKGRNKDFTVSAGMIRNPSPKARLAESHGLTMAVEVDGYHHGQLDARLVARRDGEDVGRVDFTEYDGEISIKMISVPGDLQGQGIGTAMMKELQRLNPDVEISWGLKTNAGDALYRSLPMDEIEVPEVVAKLERVAALKKRLESFQAAVDRFEQGSHSDEARASLEAFIEPWNDIHDEVYSLEMELRDQKPSKVLIRH